MKKLLSQIVFVMFLFFLNTSLAQQLTPPQQQTINKLFKSSNVVYFKFKVRSMQEIPQFAKIVSVDKTKGAEVSAHANKAQFSQFIRMNYAYTVTSGGTVKKKVAKTSPAKKPPVKKK
ncbi:MAG: hypothetical protein NTX97_03170 [Bacteroidetes bacterium]|nr:hypothetical protein [Bacteroidota bacterium]